MVQTEENKMNKMNKRIKKLWIDALRSGDYKQTDGQLRDANGFCCLGVLCNIHAQEHPEIASNQTDPEKYLGSSGFLPKEVVEWAGLDDVAIKESYSEWSIYYDDCSSLHEENDEGTSFLDISDIIEEHL